MAAQGRRGEVAAMSISRAEVEKVSLLARLVLSSDELDRMTSQLGDILGYRTLELLASLAGELK